MPSSSPIVATLLLVVAVATQCACAASPSQQYGLPTLLSIAGDNDYYHGSPVVLELPVVAAGGAPVLIAAYEKSKFPSSASGILGQSIVVSQSLDGGASWTAVTQLFPQNMPAEPFWAPALYYDNATSTLFLYFSQSISATGGEILMCRSSDLGASFTAPQPVIGVSGVITRGAVITVDASKDMQGLPTWAFAVNSVINSADGSTVTPTGIVLVRAQVNSTIYEVSTAVLPPSYTSAVLVSLLSAVPSSTTTTKGTAAIAAALIASNATAGSDEPLQVFVTSDVTLASGWTVSPSLPILSPADRSFTAVSTTSSSSVFVAVATFSSNISSDLLYSSMQLSAVDQQLTLPNAALLVNATLVNSSDYQKPAKIEQYTAQSAFLAPLTHAAPATASGSFTSFVTVYTYDGQIFASRLGLELRPVVVGSPAPSSSTAIAITFIIIVTVVVVLGVVFAVGHIREKRASKDENTALMKPDEEDAYTGDKYSGSL